MQSSTNNNDFLCYDVNQVESVLWKLSADVVGVVVHEKNRIEWVRRREVMETASWGRPGHLLDVSGG